MTFEELRGASVDQLRQYAGDRFDEYSKSGNQSRVELLWEAQFFMRELEHRETQAEYHAAENERQSGRRTAWRDFILEVVVILLIAGEIGLAIKQGKDEDVMMGEQNRVLTALNASAADTTRALKLLYQQMDQQLTLTASARVDISYAMPEMGVRIANNGNIDLAIWGTSYRDGPIVLEKTPVALMRGGQAVLTPPQIHALRPRPAVSGKFRAYMKDDFGGEYVAEFEMSLKGTDKGVDSLVGQNYTTRKRWSGQ